MPWDSNHFQYGNRASGSPSPLTPMVSFNLHVFPVVVAAIVCATFWAFIRIVIRPLRSPLRVLPGPRNPSWILGNFWEIFTAEPGAMVEKWVQEYGGTLCYKGTFNVDRLLTLDLKALNHVLTRSDIYVKPEITRTGLIRLMGEGVLVTEGEKHKQQRRIMNPAFGPGQIRELTGIFLDKANELRDCLSAVIAGDHAHSDKSSGAVRIDILSWLSKATLDIIGLAGFNYRFESLANERDELASAFGIMFSSANQNLYFGMLMRWIPQPLARLIKTKRARNIAYARQTMKRIGTRLLEEKKAAVRAAEANPESKAPLERDLLSILVRANMAAGVGQRMDDEDVLAQIPTFLVAGHETTATATTWVLFALSLQPELQARLRTELGAITLPTTSTRSGTPCQSLTADELSSLNNLPLLDAVVRETLRLHAPVPSTIRKAVQDDVIPLDHPIIGTDGKQHDHIRINKGEAVNIPILTVNRSRELWGDDALEFRPERWLNPPECIRDIPGVWGNLLTFIGGSHACIGYRFSLIEMKILLHVLLTSFSYELAVPVSDIIRKSFIVQRPIVVSEKEKGNQMPLLVTPVRAGIDM